MLRKSSLVAVLFALFAFAHADNIVDEIIARVNDWIITRADLQRGTQATQEELRQRFPGEWQSKWPEAQKNVLRDLIDQKLLLEKGKELGITGDTEVIKRLNELRQQMGLASIDDLEKEAAKQGVSFEDFKDQIRTNVITQQVIGREVGGRLHITNEEVQAFYNEHQKDMAAPETIQLREILVSTQPLQKSAADKDKAATPSVPMPEDQTQVKEAEAKANQLLDQLRKGASFEDLAKKNSDGPTAAQGGDLGEFKRGELDKQLEDKTFALKAGEYTDVVKTKQGFIIFKVVAHQQPGVPALKDVSDKIREAIYVQKLEPAARAYLTKLREEAFIEIKAGFVDSGASPNQGKPMVVAANDPVAAAEKHKKKKKFVVF